MQELFPALTKLDLMLRPSEGREIGVCCSSWSILGWICPTSRICAVWLPFPELELSNFLSLSVNHLTCLILHDIPHSGYIAPEAMVACISALINLEVLHLEFLSSHSKADVCVCQHVLFNPLSLHLGLANTWRVSWPRSMPFNSTT